MENKLKLLDEFSNFLSNLPEHGIGYQIVDIELKNGEILKDRIVFNTIFIKLNENETIDTKDIVSIRIK